MDEQTLTAILNAGGGMDHLRDVVLWFRRKQGDYLFDATKAEITATLGSSSSSVDRWSKDREELVSKLFTAENMKRLSTAYDLPYAGLLAAVGVIPEDMYDGELPPFRRARKKGGRPSPIRRPRP